MTTLDNNDEPNLVIFSTLFPALIIIATVTVIMTIVLARVRVYFKKHSRGYIVVQERELAHQNQGS